MNLSNTVVNVFCLRALRVAYDRFVDLLSAQAPAHPRSVRWGDYKMGFGVASEGRRQALRSLPSK